jgi:RNA polymerase sigma factor (TIGR02999 family)
VGDVSSILAKARGETREAVMGQLLPIVYDELRVLARAHLRKERPDHTLQATALVHEAYLRLLAGANAPWNDRQHFFRAAAEAMRRILVEHARGRERVKRGGRQERVDLSTVDVADGRDPELTLALDDAFCRLEKQDPDAADVVRLRFYAGLSVQETASATGLSERTVKREWAFARAWLFDALKDPPPYSGAATRGEKHGDGPVGAGQTDLPGDTRHA